MCNNAFNIMKYSDLKLLLLVFTNIMGNILSSQIFSKTVSFLNNISCVVVHLPNFEVL